MSGNVVIYIFSTMDTKLIVKTCFYILSENSPYIIEAYQNQSGSWE